MPSSSAELRRLVPALADHCLGGLVVRQDGSASPYHTTMAFKHAGEAAGVRFDEGVRLLGIGQTGCLTTSRSSARRARRPASSMLSVFAATAFSSAPSSAASSPT
jgi:glycine/D-amino acid oxidase-like deaminating enzyme